MASWRMYTSAPSSPAERHGKVPPKPLPQTLNPNRQVGKGMAKYHKPQTLNPEPCGKAWQAAIACKCFGVHVVGPAADYDRNAAWQRRNGKAFTFSFGESMACFRV